MIHDDCLCPTCRPEPDPHEVCKADAVERGKLVTSLLDQLSQSEAECADLKAKLEKERNLSDNYAKVNGDLRKLWDSWRSRAESAEALLVRWIQAHGLGTCWACHEQGCPLLEDTAQYLAQKAQKTPGTHGKTKDDPTPTPPTNNRS